MVDTPDTIEEGKEWVESKRRGMQQKSVQDMVVEMLWLADEGDRMAAYLGGSREYDWEGEKVTVTVRGKENEMVRSDTISFDLAVDIEGDEFQSSEGVIMVRTEDEWAGPGHGPWCPPLLYVKVAPDSFRNIALLGRVEAVVREDGKYA